MHAWNSTLAFGILERGEKFRLDRSWNLLAAAYNKPITVSLCFLNNEDDTENLYMHA